MENLSALIFVALAVAWAAYLIPKALSQHVEADATRSVERFSSRLRVLARREPAGPRVTLPAASRDTAGPTELRARRLAIHRATKRRRRVLSLLVVACVVVGGLAGYGTIDSWYAAIPAGLLLAWLVTCRLMVKREASVWAPREPLVRASSAVTRAADDASRIHPDDGADLDTEVMSPVAATASRVDPRRVVTETADPSLWDPVPVTLPTYVSKPAATRRTVRFIDLESSGVWTSGRSEAESRLAREAEDADKAAKAEVPRQLDAEHDRAVGS
ncbi:MAG: divisome protein SepX/GlpR [Nocardioides sp.]